jgi:polyisoprenoid-binding protein YceI
MKTCACPAHRRSPRLPPDASAAPLKTDPAKSSVAAVFKQMNVPVESKFKTLHGADRLRRRASGSIEGARRHRHRQHGPGRRRIQSSEIAKKEWFNSAQFPKASFVSTSIKPAGAGKLNVTGKLTIKGKTADVSFPLSVKTEGGKQVFEGQLPIKRLAFNIGEGEWKDTSMVADEVVIKFRVTAGQ